MGTLPQDLVVNWIQTLSSDERIGYIKRLIDACPLEDIKPLRTVLSNTAKRKSPFPRNYAKKIRLGLLPTLTANVASVSTSVVPASTAAVQGWWEQYNPEDIIGLDTEMVTLKEKTSKGKHINKAATVGIVNSKGDVVYKV